VLNEQLFKIKSTRTENEKTTNEINLTEVLDETMVRANIPSSKLSKNFTGFV